MFVIVLLFATLTLAGSGTSIFEFRIVFRAQLRKPLYKSDDGPETVVRMRGAKRRHTGHLDPILQDPKNLGARPFRFHLSKVGGRWIEALADLSAFLSRRTMACDAHFTEFQVSLAHLLLRKLCRGLDGARSRGNRTTHCCVQYP